MDQETKLKKQDYKTLRRNKGNLHDLGFVNAFLALTPKAQATTEKIDKLDFIKIKNFCAS